MNYAFDEISNPALRPVRQPDAARACARSADARAGPAEAAEPDAARASAEPEPAGHRSDGHRRSRRATGFRRRPAGPSRLLEVRHLSVAYATDAGPVVAVNDVDLDLDGGEFLAIVGESGCGKSTLLFAIAQLLNPPAGITGGSVNFRGREMAR